MDRGERLEFREERSERSGPRRKMVTALFCDVAGSTALGEELDPEALHAVMSGYFAVVRAIIERHGGTVEKFIGDAVMAVFGIPRVREDDALRAVRAAAEIGERRAEVAEETGVELRFRTGVNTGPVLMGEGGNLAIGDAVNVAARLEQAAEPGEILLGEETFRLVRNAVEVEPLEPLALKGKSSPVRAFRLLSVDQLAPGVARRLDAPLVGRERELDLLRSAWDRSVRESGCHLFTLLGAAGVGKSRLVLELVGQLQDSATVLSGRCLPYGEGITFWPLLEALSRVGEPARQALDRLGGGGTAVPEELFFEVRVLLESLARERPMILHVDDLQWAQPMLLDLLDHIIELSRGAPILILCSARSELLEQRPAWGGRKLTATTVLLEPLGARECERLLDQLGDRLEPEARARVIAASEGNPLFIEEMAALTRERGEVAVPSTIQALLAARLEALESSERDLLERGAIEGEVFHHGPLCALAGEHLAGELEPSLARLVRKELIRAHPPTFENDRAFRFRHLLIRDAAYDAVPKATRAMLHERFAGWLEQNAGELPELDEIAGWHLEQSVGYLRQVGRDADLRLVERAAERLHAAGLRAGARSDPAAARNLLERAYALAPEERALRVQAAVDLAEQLIESGEFARADELLATAEQRPDSYPLTELIRLDWLINARQQEALPMIEATMPSILTRLAKGVDERGLAKAHLVAFQADWLPGRGTAAAEHALLAAEHARKAGEDRLRATAMAWYLASIAWGPEDVQTIEEKLEGIEHDAPGPYLTQRITAIRSKVERHRGHLDKARELTQAAIDLQLALGLRAVAAEAHRNLAELELLDGDATAALKLLLEGDAILAEMGEESFRSTTQADLARTYERLGDAQSAHAAIALSDQLGGPDDLLNTAITHAVRGRLALAEGDNDAAERWARSAVQTASTTEWPLVQADARLELARILSALERHDDAISDARAALELYEAKGDLPGTKEAAALLDELSARAPREADPSAPAPTNRTQR